MLQEKKKAAKSLEVEERRARLLKKTRVVNTKRLSYMLLGLVLFLLVYLSPSWPDVSDPTGKIFSLSHKGKAAIGLFLLTAVWWVFEVIPVGVTSVLAGIIQAIFLIRSPKVAFNDFMDPSVWFIFGSIMIGVVFTKSGLTKRLAYRVLMLMGERTSMIYLGCFLIVLVLTLIMAHTAVAAAVFSLLLAIYNLYDDGDKPTKFGKGLFIGMAFVAGAGSAITLLGAARGAVALGFFSDITGGDISFFEYTYYMFPLGVTMVFFLWLLIMILYKPEKPRIVGLRLEAKKLYKKLGPIKRIETTTLVIVFVSILILALRSFFPALGVLNKSAIILMPTVLFFIFRILTIEDLESVPWNIILLFGGAMSIGFCLWQTGAATWLAINWLKLFHDAKWFVFVIGIAFFVLIMTNLIMNVAAIAVSLPVALVISPYLGVAPEIILFASVATAAMPFLLLVGAAPNAIAYNSKQFTSRQFFSSGIWASLILMIVLSIFVIWVWPIMGMPVLLAP
jgi:sodium-dependent dicarboxylate transporter 2/3/5